jgi:hypothetical protein
MLRRLWRSSMERFVHVHWLVPSLSPDMILIRVSSYHRSSRVVLSALIAPLLADRDLQEDQWVAEVEEVRAAFQKHELFFLFI